MWFSKKLNADVRADAPSQVTTTGALAAAQSTTKARGDAAESLAMAHLQAGGLKLVAKNFKTPGRGGGEIDLIMSAPDGTLVFIEVRQRASTSHGGAGASISALKQRRIVFAARHYLMRFKTLPPCRFDVLLVHGDVKCGVKCDVEGSVGGPVPAQIEWLRGAFDAN